MDYKKIVNDYLFPKPHQNNLHKSFRQTDNLIYIRLCCFLYLTGIYLWSLVFMPNAIDNFIYLTMQGYFLAWVYFALTLQDYLSRRILKEELIPGLWKLCCIIFEMAICLEVPITLVFWTMLMAIIVDLPGVDANIIAVNVNLHAGPFICLLIDLLFNCIEFPKRHFFVTLSFGCIYLLINFFWTVLYKTIYRPIDWVSFLSYVLVAACIGITYLAHFLCRMYYKRVKKVRMESLEMRESMNIKTYMNDQE